MRFKFRWVQHCRTLLSFTRL